MEEEKLDLVDLQFCKESITPITLAQLSDSGLVTQQGFRIQGQGLVLKKLDQIWWKLDDLGLKMHKQQQALDRMSGYKPNGGKSEQGIPRDA